MKTAFRFATVELCPYPELGEFVIVGVVLVTRRRELVFRVLPANRTTRLTRFFPEIERAVFTETLRAVKAEFEILEMNLQGGHIGTEPLNLDGGEWQTIFQLLTAPREGFLRIESRGTAIADDTDRWINNAFERFVMRTVDGITDPAERTLTEHIGGLLREWRLAKLYRAEMVGGEHIHARFPFAYTPEGIDTPRRVIKPLHLAQDTPTKVLEHGDAWLQKIRRLRQFRKAPAEIIFPVKIPVGVGEHASERNEVAACVIQDFQKEGVVVVDDRKLDELRMAVHIDPIAKSENLFA
ncbi:MAG: DUF3037 domain-containing protein [Chthoniobacterales bacterium]